MVGQITTSRNVDPRRVWMRQNKRTKPFEAGRWAGVPMHGLRIATIGANLKDGH